MNDYKRQTNHDCPPARDPADQPKEPGGTGCNPLPTRTPPTLAPPTACPAPDPACNCPDPPGSSPNCLEVLIAQQTADIAAAEKAKVFKADLEGLLGKAKAAGQEYTREKYEKLLKQWVEQDAEIAELIRKLVCAVPCWRCIIECHVCPLLNELHYAEQWLYGDGTLYTDVHNLHDLQYWHTRNKDDKERILQSIKNGLTAWEKLAPTLEKALNDIKALIDAAGKSLGADAGKVVYDVFLRLVPMHLAIAPPISTSGGSAWITKIGKEYTQFCPCDEGKPDDCCGPDVGERSLRQRLIGELPYLIDPIDYFKVICCLVEKRYGPAKEALSKAEADLVAVETQIKRYKAQIENGLKSFDKDVKATIPAGIDCCKYENEERAPKSDQAR